MTDLLKNKPDFMYEDLDVLQVDIVKHPATSDKFLSIRSDDGTFDKIPVMNKALADLIKNKDNITVRETDLGEEKMAKLDEAIEKLSTATELLERNTSLFSNLIKENNDKKVEEETTDAEASEDVETATSEDASVENVITEEVTEEVTAEDSTEEGNAPIEEVIVNETMEAAHAVEESAVVTPEPAVEVAPPVENTEMVAMREALDKLTNAITTFAGTQESLRERLETVERSVTTPKTKPVDENQEASVERSSGAVFGGIIKL